LTEITVTYSASWKLRLFRMANLKGTQVKLW